jgi:formyltetrahydrofolate-dependent phosphoribosylglycinamide formyltransferase
VAAVSPLVPESFPPPGEGRRYPALAVFASGSGTTFQAILDGVAAGRLPVRVNLLVVDRAGTGAEERARRAGIPVVLVDRREVSPDRLSEVISDAIPAETEMVMLAGYLSIVREPLLTRFRGRMLNLHPALLPDFGGPGMYGEHVHRAVLAAGRTRTGCTVHFVDAGTDTGEVLLQRRIPILPGDTVRTIQERLRPVEHRAVIDAIETLAQSLR